MICLHAYIYNILLLLSFFHMCTWYNTANHKFSDNLLPSSEFSSQMILYYQGCNVQWQRCCWCQQVCFCSTVQWFWYRSWQLQDQWWVQALFLLLELLLSCMNQIAELQTVHYSSKRTVHMVTAEWGWWILWLCTLQFILLSGACS